MEILASPEPLEFRVAEEKEASIEKAAFLECASVQVGLSGGGI
jgi:hypothetical protein